MSMVEDVLDMAAEAEELPFAWYCRIVEATGQILQVYSGTAPEMQDSNPGEVWIHVDRKPERGDSFVDVGTREMYRETLGDRTRELLALQNEIDEAPIGPPAPRSRVLRKS